MFLTEEDIEKIFVSGYVAGRKSAGFYILTNEELKKAFKDSLTEILGEYPNFKNINSKEQ